MLPKEEEKRSSCHDPFGSSRRLWRQGARQHFLCHLLSISVSIRGQIASLVIVSWFRLLTWALIAYSMASKRKLRHVCFTLRTVRQTGPRLFVLRWGCATNGRAISSCCPACGGHRSFLRICVLCDHTLPPPTPTLVPSYPATLAEEGN